MKAILGRSAIFAVTFVPVPACGTGENATPGVGSGGTSGGGVGAGSGSDVAGAASGGVGASVTAPSAGPRVGRCAVFPADNAWNLDVSEYPLHPDSSTFIDSMGPGAFVHPDFGSEWQGAPIGIPFVAVSGIQTSLPVEFTAYGDESDPGPYPLPLDAPIEGGPDATGDRHAIAIDTDTCTLYELYRAFPGSDSWQADSGAVFDLSRNDEHPMTWTSADAAGLPILPGLVRYDEVVERGELLHAVRFTASRTRRAVVAPARHYASSSDDPSLPPMGLRLRLSASHDCGGYARESRVVCEGLKRFGILLADNGSNWYLSGAPDPRWDDEALRDLKSIPGSAFEVVDTGPIETY